MWALVLSHDLFFQGRSLLQLHSYSCIYASVDITQVTLDKYWCFLLK